MIRNDIKSCKLCNYVGDDFETNRCTCRTCRNEYKIQISRTEIGHIKKVYFNQKKASRKREHSLPAYSLIELQNWFISQQSFQEIYTTWKQSGYKKWLAPSADRIDNTCGYSLDNIQLMTWEENDKLAHEDCMAGKLSSGIKNIPVSQYSIFNEQIATYPTIRSAARMLGKECHKEIKRCCDGIAKQAQGYIWKYAEERHNG